MVYAKCQGAVLAKIGRFKSLKHDLHKPGLFMTETTEGRVLIELLVEIGPQGDPSEADSAESAPMIH